MASSSLFQWEGVLGGHGLEKFPNQRNLGHVPTLNEGHVPTLNGSLSITLGGRYSYHLHFRNEEAEYLEI